MVPLGFLLFGMMVRADKRLISAGDVHARKGNHSDA